MLPIGNEKRERKIQLKFDRINFRFIVLTLNSSEFSLRCRMYSTFMAVPERRGNCRIIVIGLRDFDAFQAIYQHLKFPSIFRFKANRMTLNHLPLNAIGRTYVR